MKLLKIILFIFLIYFLRRFYQFYKKVKEIQARNDNAGTQSDPLTKDRSQKDKNVIDADYKVIK